MFTGMYWVPFISPELIMILLHLLLWRLVNGQIILSQNSFRDNAGCSVFSGCAAVAYVVFQTKIHYILNLHLFLQILQPLLLPFERQINILTEDSHILDQEGLRGKSKSGEKTTG
jgi:hypothetical protein